MNIELIEICRNLMYLNVLLMCIPILMLTTKRICSEVFCKKVFKLSRIHRETPEDRNFIQKETPTQVFPADFAKFLTTPFHRTPPVVATRVGREYLSNSTFVKYVFKQSFPYFYSNSFILYYVILYYNFHLFYVVFTLFSTNC